MQLTGRSYHRRLARAGHADRRTRSRTPAPSRGHHVSGPASGDLPRLPVVRTARVDEAAFAEAEPGQVSADSPPVDHKTDAHKFVGDPLRGPLVLAAPGLDLLKLKMPISAATWAMGHVWHRFTSRLRPSTLRGAFAWGTRRPLEVRQRQARHLSCAPAALWPFSPSVRPGYGSRQDRLRGRSARTPHHEARAGS